LQTFTSESKWLKPILCQITSQIDLLEVFEPQFLPYINYCYIFAEISNFTFNNILMDKKYVYLFTNEKNPGLVKIGKTDSHPEVRAQQLTRQTGVIGKYEVYWFKEVPDSDICYVIITKLKSILDQNTLGFL
jgi:hypothetical protein